jgi:hypothetical protein
VDFQIEDAGRGNLAIVDLNLVGLGKNTGWKETKTCNP